MVKTKKKTYKYLFTQIWNFNEDLILRMINVGIFVNYMTCRLQNWKLKYMANVKIFDWKICRKQLQRVFGRKTSSKWKIKKRNALEEDPLYCKECAFFSTLVDVWRFCIFTSFQTWPNSYVSMCFECKTVIVKLVSNHKLEIWCMFDCSRMVELHYLEAVIYITIRNSRLSVLLWVRLWISPLITLKDLKVYHKFH